MTLTNLEQVKLYLGGTASYGGTLLSDSELGQFIDNRSVLDSTGGTTSTNVVAAAADAAGALASRFATEFNFAEDNQRFDVSQKHSQWVVRERELRNLSGGVAVPVGGTAIT